MSDTVGGDAFRSGLDRRDEFMAEVPAWYRGGLHLAAIFLVGTGLFTGALWGLHQPRLLEIAVVPIAFLVANFFEWRIHSGAMHHRPAGGPLRILYDRHTLLHHAAFSHTSMAIRDGRELRMVLFPIPALFGAAILAGGLAAACAALWNGNAGRLFFLVAFGYYLLYEVCHLAYHLPPSAWLARNPIIRWLSVNHTRHHHPKVMMHKNFNVTFPIADAVLGTLDRGDA